MDTAKVYTTKLTIPTYPVGKEEKNPMFFEKRVYQGSSGKVYPNPVIEKIFDQKEDKEYDAIILENKYIYAILLPQLGGRIYTAYDKTNNYDFIYHNKVIKPALVGLLGPWISGGIEFNWPQHHRPSTYMPVNYKIEENSDGSVSAFMGEIENMFGLKGMTEIKLYPDKAFIEINAQIYNRGDLTETFLWWANPAYKVNDDTKTIMPPDVTAVMDHGKRAVSTFPIATGEYYKMDYSAGIDISKYKNIPVPTSFMAYKSNFDFVGGYDYGKKAGLYHFADHHVSPGKKQWTWGNGDFGVAWDRNLTDSDGPYVELMTGCFTDNQPDFTFIKPQEEKDFTQYFMPYKQVGNILNANRDFCFGMENGKVTVYSSGEYKGVKLVLKKNGEIQAEIVFDISPNEVFVKDIVAEIDDIEIIYGKEHLHYDEKKIENFEVPLPATPCPTPKDCVSMEELYLCGLHIEQYRHATRLAEDYYLEGLSRDNTDSRINNAYGLLLLRKGMFAKSVPYFEKAKEKLIYKNPNPINTEPYYYLGIAKMYLCEYDCAYDNFYKCLWSNENKTQANYYLAAIEFIRGNMSRAVAFADKSLQFNTHNMKSSNLKARALISLGKVDEAKTVFANASAIDKLDTISQYELEKLSHSEPLSLKGISPLEAINLSYDYIITQDYCGAFDFLNGYLTENNTKHPLVYFYLAFVSDKLGKSMSALVELALNCSDTICFPNRLSDIIILEGVIEKQDNYLTEYYLGNLFYDKRQYGLACKFWTKAEEMNGQFATVKRNLALYYFNKEKNTSKALKCLEQAYLLDKTDSRIFMELFQLYQILEKPEEELLQILKDNISNVEQRDDLYAEYLNLLNETGEMEYAEKLIEHRQFHSWEGGEGKITKIYKQIKINLAQKLEQKKSFPQAIAKLEQALQYPHNLGEGKLILDLDNDVYYFLGEAYALNGDKEKAIECFTKATKGKLDVADDMYYNDSPVEYQYYMALAYKKLGQMDKCNSIKKAFEDYYTKHIGTKNVIDYFAVSLPDMLIWEQDIDKKNDKFCEYILELNKKI